MSDYIHHGSGGERFHYTDCGLDNIWLTGGVETIDTPYGKATSIRDLDDLHCEIAKEIATNAISNGNMRGQEFRFLRVELDLSQRALARLLHSTEQQIRRWENDKVAIPGTAQVSLAGYYLESMDESGRVKELMDRYAELDALETRAMKTFSIRDNHWGPDAA
ncbi:helix-turn-helix domain-containing protein [Roseovarius confluentis]|uniref:helix-turn-helix domain-containing protein n=1 Tax=Roseovarius confluentis TaxID=1852027 RepID=UPI003BAB9561